jgi:pimeloyl-ACP methyl ester carboxylesterase
VSPRGPVPVAVTGGSGGISANRFDIAAAGARFSAAGHELASTRRDVLNLADGPLVGGFDPFGGVGGPSLAQAVALADARAFVHAAAADLWAAGVLCTAIGRALWAAASGYDRLEHLFDRGGVLGLFSRVLQGLEVGETSLLVTHDVGRSVQLAVTNDPDVTVALASAAGIRRAVDALADPSHDGHGVAVDTGVDGWGAAGTAPRRLSDVLADLALRNDDTRHGEIDVRILTMADGTRRAIVDIPGTKSWDPHPTRDVTDLTTNVRALAGLRTAYEDGVLAALHEAGVGRDDDVMLVGHSQGGLIAVNAARHAHGRFRITHVITAGAPVGRLVGTVPRRTQVLALENRHDLVPALDQRANPDRRNVTTAGVDLGDGTVVGDHDLAATYLPAAVAVQASPARSVRDFLAGAGGYLDARTVVTHTFQIERR